MRGGYPGLSVKSTKRSIRGQRTGVHMSDSSTIFRYFDIVDVIDEGRNSQFRRLIIPSSDSLAGINIQMVRLQRDSTSPNRFPKPVRFNAEPGHAFCDCKNLQLHPTGHIGASNLLQIPRTNLFKLHPRIFLVSAPPPNGLPKRFSRLLFRVSSVECRAQL